MTAALRAVAICAALPLCAGEAEACGEALRGATRTIEGKRHTVVFGTTPDPVPISAYFVVDFAVCPRAGATAPRAVRVDAGMPEHRHGMNYRPVVTARPGGTYRAEGLLFHMPGRWDLTFDVETGGGTERLTATLRVE